MSIARASTVMAAGTAASRLLGFVRALVLAAAVGITFAAADAFAIANTVPNNLYMLVAGGVLSAVLVPQVVRALHRPDGGQEYVDRLLTLSLTLLLVLVTVLTLAAPLVVRLYAERFSGELLALTIAFAFWCLPQIFFYGLYTLLGQVLNARGSFGPYTWAPAVNNVVGIAGLLVFLVVFGGAPHPVDSWTPGKIAVLAGSATLGVVVQALVLVIPLRRSGFRYRPRFGWRGSGLRSAGRVATWTFAAVLVGQLGYLVVTNVGAAARSRTIGTDLETSTPGMAAYGLAYLLFMLPHSLVAVSVVTALFTRMSRSAATTDLPAVRRDVSAGLRGIGVASVLATVGLVLLAGPVGMVISSGSEDSARALGRVAAAMALGLTAFSAGYLLQRAFYAFEDARTPFVVQLVATLVWTAGNLLSAAFLPVEQIVVGVGLSMACGLWAGLVVAAVLLHRRLGGIDGRAVLRTHARLLVAGVVAFAAGAGTLALLADVTWSGSAGALLTCAVVGSVVTVVYLVGLRLLRVTELDDLLRRVPGARRLARV